MAGVRTRSSTGQAGFTLVELVVVILILGILVAIALPALLDQRMDAADTNAKALARTGANAAETWGVEHTGYDATRADVLAIAPELRDAEAWTFTSSRTSYKLSVTSKYGHVFTVRRTGFGGRLERTCTTGPDPAGSGGCDEDGTW